MHEQCQKEVAVLNLSCSMLNSCNTFTRDKKKSLHLKPNENGATNNIAVYFQP